MLEIKSIEKRFKIVTQRWAENRPAATLPGGGTD
jgi:hypothetical protein